MKKIKKASRRQRVEEIFTGTQVGMLLENIRDDIKLIAEGQMGLREELHEFKEEMYAFREETNQRFTKLEVRLDLFQEEMYSFREEMYFFRDEVYSFRDAVLEDLDQINNRLDKIEDGITELNRKIDKKADKAWVLEKIKILEQQLLLVRDKAEKEYR